MQLFGLEILEPRFEAEARAIVKMPWCFMQRLHKRSTDQHPPTWPQDAQNFACCGRRIAIMLKSVKSNHSIEYLISERQVVHVGDQISVPEHRRIRLNHVLESPR